MDTEQIFPDTEQTEQPAPAQGAAPQEGGEPSWEAAASAKKKADPMPLRLAAALAILFGVFNTIINSVGVAGELGGQNVFGGLGLTALAVILLLIGLLQIVSGVMMFKAIKQPEEYRVRCRHLGMAMLIVTVAYMVPVFMIRRQFIPNTLFGPIVSVVYLTVQKAWEKPPAPEKQPEPENNASDSEKFPPL